jgi:hypothetical protein
MGKRTFLAVFLIALAALPAMAAQTGFAARAADLLERPAASARATGKLTKKQPLQVLAREGNWVRVGAGPASGWVRLMDVRLDPPPGKLPPLNRAKAAKDNGVRGFSEEELLAGTPGASEIDKLGRYAVAAKDASGYARAAGLKARALDYLDPADVLAPDRLPDDFFDE